MLTRRHFVAASLAIFSQPVFGVTSAAASQWSEWDAQVTPANFDPATYHHAPFHYLAAANRY